MASSVLRGRRRGYRHHPLAFKRQVVEQTLEAGASVALIAREHGLNANQVFAWRKAYREGLLGAPTAIELLPVSVSTTAPSSTDGALVLESPRGRLRIEGRPDAQTLAQVLEALLR